MTEQAIEPGRIYAEMTDTPTSYVREPPDAHPPLDHPPYKSTALRHPKQPLVYLPQTVTEITGPQLGDLVSEGDNDLTSQHQGEPIGERIVVSGHVHDTVPSWAVAYRFDIYLRGPGATPFEEAH